MNLLKIAYMKGKIKITLILLLALSGTFLSGQSGQVSYFMNIPQNHMMNPAMRPSNSLYIGLPVISGTSVTVNNNFANYSDIFSQSGTSDSLISILDPEYNVDKFLDNINNKNSIAPQMSLQTFGLGFSTSKGLYIFLDITERFEANAVFPMDIAKLILKGNEGFADSRIDLSALRMDLKYFREFGFGFSKDFSEKLRIGVRPKILSGILSTSLENRSLGISVSDDYTHTLDADITANISAPLTVYTGTDGKIDSVIFDDSRFDSGKGIFDVITGTKNYGLGLDIGATYDLFDKLVVSASITDLGYIKWKRDVSNITAKSQFVFSGIDVTDVANGSKTFDDLTNELLDSLKDSFEVTTTHSPYTTWLSPGLTLAGSYNLTKDISFGLLSYTRFIGKQVKESLTLSGNVNLGNSFSFSLGYSLQNHRADNLGAGLAFRAGVFQFYLISDRIPITWERIKMDEGSTVVAPANWNTVNLRVGMNLVFGNKVKKKDDKPMIQSNQIL
jgi:hypothetical protein